MFDHAPKSILLKSPTNLNIDDELSSVTKGDNFLCSLRLES